MARYSGRPRDSLLLRLPMGEMLVRFIASIVFAATSMLSNASRAEPPAVRWSFDAAGDDAFAGTPNGLKGVADGTAKQMTAGKDGGVLAIEKGSGFVRVADPGDASVLDITNGDSLTLEAQVRPAPGSITNGQHMHVVGKGRTRQFGSCCRQPELRTAPHRREGAGGDQLSVPIGTRRRPRKGQYHRWTSTDTFPRRRRMASHRRHVSLYGSG